MRNAGDAVSSPEHLPVVEDEAVAVATLFMHSSMVQGTIGIGTNIAELGGWLMPSYSLHAVKRTPSWPAGIPPSGFNRRF